MVLFLLKRGGVVGSGEREEEGGKINLNATILHKPRSTVSSFIRLEGVGIQNSFVFQFIHFHRKRPPFLFILKGLDVGAIAMCVV